MKKINRRKFITDSTLIGTSVLALGGISKASNLFLFNEDFDILIKNGSIIDGTGLKAYKADIGIKNGVIKEIGNLKKASAAKVINANGLDVSPGFIDIHTHTDLGILENPNGESKIRQGVTTEIGGNCGDSFAPLSNQEFEEKKKEYLDKYGLELRNGNFEAHFEMLNNWKFAVNQAALLGMGTVRRIAVGMDDRPPTSSEMEKMKDIIIAALKEGAVGISTGLEYTPGSFASTEELIELYKAIPAQFSHLYATHMRNEDNTVEEAVEEAIQIAKKAGVRLQLSHLKASGKSNWHKTDNVLAMMDNAINSGLEVHADRYTYVAYHTYLSNLYPLWSRDGGDEAFMTRLKDQTLYDKLKNYAEKKASNLDGGWNGVVVSGLQNADMQDLKGLSITAISEKFGMDPFDTSIKLLLEAKTNVMIVGFGMDEQSTEKILAHPRVMIASDASAHAPYPPMNKNNAHPRAYGTFPRAIKKYVKERNICTREEMIKKMTSLPAEKIGINDRGIIAKGKKADITLFDYEKINDKATFIDSSQYPDGIPYVLVNGKVVVENGKQTGELPGEVIIG